MKRYERQIALPELGADGQARLGAASVLVVGAGGLAATALPLLAGAGVGRIVILDHDVVDLGNLHRQHLFAERDCGQPKAEIAAARLRALNSDIRIDAHVDRLTPANTATYGSDVDAVIDCADSYAVSYTLSDFCLEKRVPFFSASALGLGGYAGGFCAGAPSLRAVFPDAPERAETCANAGVLGPVVSMIGAMQAQMVLAHLAGIAPNPLGHLVRLDGQTFRTSSFRFDGTPEPEVVFAFVAADDLEPMDVIVELRDEAEAPEPIHPKALRLSPEGFATRLPMASTRLALCCASGLRAWRAADDIYPDWPGEIVLVAASAS